MHSVCYPSHRTLPSLTGLSVALLLIKGQNVLLCSNAPFPLFCHTSHVGFVTFLSLDWETTIFPVLPFGLKQLKALKFRKCSEVFA